MNIHGVRRQPSQQASATFDFQINLASAHHPKMAAQKMNEEPHGDKRPSGKSADRTRAKHELACGRDLKARGPLAQLVGRLVIILTLVSFIFVGLLLNCVQLVLALTIRLSSNQSWRRWHKQLHGRILYAIFAQPVYLLYAWPRWDLSILLEDMKLMEEVQSEIMGVVIANHTYELDWMTCLLMADQLGNMGNYKCFSKDELKWLPIVGWTFWMADLIYVKRDWRQDRVNISQKLNELLHYDQWLLGIFAEGTRWTEEKRRDAVEFAQRRNLEPYRHHLFPRPRGFNFTLRHYLRRAELQRDLKADAIRLFNLQIIMPDRPTFQTFLEGGLLRACIYCEEVPLSRELRAEAVKSRDEDDCPKLTKLLQDIYRRKDQLVDEFFGNGNKFPLKSPRSGYFPARSPRKALAYWLAGMSVTYGTLAYLALTFFARSAAFWACVVGFLASGLLLLRRIERESAPTKLRQRAGGRGNKAPSLADTRQSAD